VHYGAPPGWREARRREEYKEGTGKVQGRYREGTGKVQGRYREGAGKVHLRVGEKLVVESVALGVGV